MITEIVCGGSGPHTEYAKTTLHIKSSGGSGNE